MCCGCHVVKSERGSCKRLVGKMITGETIRRNAEGFVTRGYNASPAIPCRGPTPSDLRESTTAGWASQDGDEGVVIVPSLGIFGQAASPCGVLGWGMQRCWQRVRFGYQSQTSPGSKPSLKVVASSTRQTHGKSWSCRRCRWLQHLRGSSRQSPAGR